MFYIFNVYIYFNVWTYEGNSDQEVDSTIAASWIALYVHLTALVTGAGPCASTEDHSGRPIVILTQPDSSIKGVAIPPATCSI